MSCTWHIALLAAVTATVACRSNDETRRAEAAELTAREQRLETRLAKADASDSDQAPVAMWLMPRELSEISGIALTPDGRLLAHDDEIGKIYEIDPRRGVILKTFLLGKGPHADFEGITVAGGEIYLLASNGVLFRFREGANGSSVPYTTHDTRLGKECEFEGVAFQPDSAWLVLPCKTVHRKKLGGDLVLYRWRIGAKRDSALSMLTVPINEVIGSNKWKSFRPSDIAIDPATGDYVMISSADKALVEITPAGEVVRARSLPGTHRQPEGVAITKDGILMISDEGSTRAAAITLYHWSRAQEGDTSR